MTEYFDECIKLAEKAYKLGEIPVGAIVINNGKIIGKGFNQRIRSNDVTGHAEVIAIKEAANFINDWRLNGCDLFVTLKPCAMCEEIIKESRIDNVYYLIEKDSIKKGYSKTIFNKMEDVEKLSTLYSELITTFFKENCKR